jgi:hypothetical protein
MDTCVYRLEYEADVCPQRLKDVKEQVNLNEYRIRLAGQPSKMGIILNQTQYQLHLLGFCSWS